MSSDLKRVDANLGFEKGYRSCTVREGERVAAGAVAVHVGDNW